MPHLPYFVIDYVDSLPIVSIGVALSDVLFNPKYESHICKVSVPIDSLGHIVWICPLAPGTSVDVFVWDDEGPQRAKGHFKNYELAPMIALIKATYTPLSLSLGTIRHSGNKNTTVSMDIAHLRWNICASVCGTGIWCAKFGGATGPHFASLTACCCTSPNFELRTKLATRPIGPWPLVPPPHVWAAL